MFFPTRVTTVTDVSNAYFSDEILVFRGSLRSENNHCKRIVATQAAAFCPIGVVLTGWRCSAIDGHKVLTTISNQSSDSTPFAHLRAALIVKPKTAATGAPKRPPIYFPSPILYNFCVWMSAGISNKSELLFSRLFCLSICRVPRLYYNWDER